jgi:hypothetical protein
VWQGILEFLRREADLEWIMLDGTVIRAHQHSAGQSDLVEGMSRG